MEKQDIKYLVEGRRRGDTIDYCTLILQSNIDIQHGFRCTLLEADFSDLYNESLSKCTTPHSAAPT